MEDVERFIALFHRKFGKQHPKFHKSTYRQAKMDAKREVHFLLVYLHRGDVSANRFCKKVLCSRLLCRCVEAQADLMVWGCSTNCREGQAAVEDLQVETFPFLGLLVEQNSEMVLASRIPRLWSVCPRLMVQTLEQHLADNRKYLDAARTARDVVLRNRLLRQQQDEAYLASLKADKEKERRRQEEARKLKEREEHEKLRVQVRYKTMLDSEIRKFELKRRLPPPPDKDDPDAVRVLLKTPRGENIHVAFLKHQPLSLLHDFVFCHSLCPDNFRLVRNFPRSELQCEGEDTPTFEQALGLEKRVTLYVQDEDS